MQKVRSRAAMVAKQEQRVIIQPKIMIRQGSENVRDHVDEELSRASRADESLFSSCTMHEFQTGAWLDEEGFPESTSYGEEKTSSNDSYSIVQGDGNHHLERSSTESLTYMKSFGMPVDTTFMDSLIDQKVTQEFWEALDQYFIRPQKPDKIEDVPRASNEEELENIFVHEDVEFDLTQHEIQQRRARQLQRRQALIKLVSCFNMGERPIDHGMDHNRRPRPSRTTVTPINASVPKTNYRSVQNVSKDSQQGPADLRSHYRACMLTPTTFMPHPKRQIEAANSGLGSIEVGEEFVQDPFYATGAKT